MSDFVEVEYPPVIMKKIEKAKEEVAKVILPEIIDNDGEGKNKNQENRLEKSKNML